MYYSNIFIVFYNQITDSFLPDPITQSSWSRNTFSS